MEVGTLVTMWRRVGSGTKWLRVCYSVSHDVG